MLRLALIGVWLIVVTAGATLASIYMGNFEAGETSETDNHGIETLTSELASIPIIRGGDVTGYLVLQLSFGADKAAVEGQELDPLPFIKDAAFRVIFTSVDIDFRRLKKDDFDLLSQRIGDEANRRLGSALVRHVLFQQLNYVKKEDIRTNWISGSNDGK